MCGRCCRAGAPNRKPCSGAMDWQLVGIGQYCSIQSFNGNNTDTSGRCRLIIVIRAPISCQSCEIRHACVRSGLLFLSHVADARVRIVLVLISRQTHAATAAPAPELCARPVITIHQFLITHCWCVERVWMNFEPQPVRPSASHPRRFAETIARPNVIIIIDMMSARPHHAITPADQRLYLCTAFISKDWDLWRPSHHQLAVASPFMRLRSRFETNCRIINLFQQHRRTRTAPDRVSCGAVWCYRCAAFMTANYYGFVRPGMCWFYCQEIESCMVFTRACACDCL